MEFGKPNREAAFRDEAERLRREKAGRPREEGTADTKLPEVSRRGPSRGGSECGSGEASSRSHGSSNSAGEPVRRSILADVADRDREVFGPRSND